MSKFKSIGDENLENVVIDLINIYKIFRIFKNGDIADIIIEVKDSIVYLGETRAAAVSIFDIGNKIKDLESLKLELEQDED